MQVAETIKVAFCSEMPHAQVEIIPMADGGEGTLEAIFAVEKGKVVEVDATGPMGNGFRSRYGIMETPQTVVIETAHVIGLRMVLPGTQNIMLTTSYGLGEIMLDAIRKGSRNFIIGLGGSATNDGGLGLLMALGGKFLDAGRNPLRPIAASLLEIRHIDLSGLNATLKECDVKIASDVENPLCGKNGASYIFGPQKGATPAQTALLDNGLKNFAKLMEAELKQNLQDKPGAGAAGGLGFALMAIGGEIHSGAKIIAETTALEAKIKESDWVITGEGQSDYQTLFGKAPYFVGKMAKQHGVKAILISGSLGQGHDKLLDYFASCHAIVNRPMALKEAMDNAESLLAACSRNVARLIANASK